MAHNNRELIEEAEQRRLNKPKSPINPDKKQIAEGVRSI